MDAKAPPTSRILSKGPRNQSPGICILQKYRRKKKKKCTLDVYEFLRKEFVL